MSVIGIIGLGLIGGSIGLILRKKYKVIGTDLNDNNSSYAKKIGIVDEITSYQYLIKKSSIIILCTPVDNIIHILPDILNRIDVNKNTVVLDTGSTKYTICNSVYNHPNRNRFVATHPIAGTEFSGAKSADCTLFDKKNCIICDYELSDHSAIVIVKKIFSTIMNMHITYMSSKEHDFYISYTSHLPHVISFSLSRMILNKFDKKNDIKIIFKKMIGSSLISNVRLANSNPNTWNPIFLSNKNNIINSINLYISCIKLFRNYLSRNKFSNLYEYINESNNIKKYINMNKKDKDE
ncbi:prephenate dehydrogenase/arogenate dehydrogenase family protein [Blattabacterium cuenoti]|uniref:prephenate dehydrogenase/arogenate dehydrogenase family protein n=1 Tax=Blattabacterium cuenoti TaxID=1653831 RepID=UPI00163C5947|nr:prephenate dehydrogenase/arogenate dehydrogenase family protein [Blattabacterium cuenoti]